MSGPDVDPDVSADPVTVRVASGAPYDVVIGRGLADGELELKDRATGEARPVPVDGAVAAVLAEVRDGR